MIYFNHNKNIHKKKKSDLNEDIEREEKEFQLALALSLEKSKEEQKIFQEKSKFNENYNLSTPEFSPPTTISKVKALYDFQASEPGELSFQKGDIITVLDTTYKDWWRGSLNGNTGIFPTNYVEKIAEPTPDELKKEIEDEIKVLSFEENIEKLLKILSNIDSVDNNNIIESDQFQNLYNSTLAIRSKLVKLIKKYAQKKDDMVSLNERFTKALKDYEILMEKSLAHFSQASLYNPSTKQYHTPIYEDSQKLQHSDFAYQNKQTDNSPESYYLNARHD